MCRGQVHLMSRDITSCPRGRKNLRTWALRAELVVGSTPATDAMRD
jgi:hypothetical protein